MKLNLKKIILLICTTSLVLPIWLDALYIPHKANTLAFLKQKTSNMVIQNIKKNYLSRNRIRAIL